MDQRALWDRYRKHLCDCPSVGLRLDVSRMRFPDGFFDQMRPAMDQALAAMDALEKGAVANPDEQRMVGHYWLRAPELAPRPELRQAIEQALSGVKDFARAVHAGEIRPPGGGKFEHVLVVGIGGSALGPQLCADALTAGDRDAMRPWFLDNTDPDGIDRVLDGLGERLGRTLAVVISKSGGTKETRNGMLEAARAYGARRLDFARHAVAVTGDGSELDQLAVKEGWLRRFPMWDWVGGRTSETSAVGLVPAALQGVDVDALLGGARDMDAVTRSKDVAGNPAALLALMWHHAGRGRGEKDMVVLPYKDRLLLLSRYLQQLVMESLGKEKDLQGRTVHQGIAVYGNKGSTDQHAYVQQLRDGVQNFFVTFIQVLKDRNGASVEVEPDATPGDYLLGFLLGTRRALFEKDRESITVTIQDAGARSLGALIALFERAVGLYASLVGINAYHQPGVEAGKKAAAAVLALQRKALERLRAKPGPRTAEELAGEMGAADEVETVFQVLEHLAANPDHQVKRTAGKTPFDARYQV
ncbi:MAG TPA: glucose-6-phosphate isomerase [Myxococcales bacterium]|nr:glucose-6-phosphate isomerase [Myxococcales bacterium]